MSVKTNAMRMLETAGISFEVHEYPVDEHDLSGAHVASVLGVPPDHIFKTLVLKGDPLGFFVCCIPTDAKIDLKKAAKVSYNKSAVMIPVKDLQSSTGYRRGGCSPIGMKKKFPTYVDETAFLYETIYVSAGIRGMMLALAPGALVPFIEGVLADMTSCKREMS